ncbi:hypothetical protein Patl1_21959 [Pistacia atlantica]|uniref:Uncharacterized protein n=1 Tax=Pistacia atlantica TaxID=434234 RepID=A0ACC1BJ62_9ROSI|nr:hypothetical protein Patl1_21959 [Pistacia atlantica]
MEREGRGEGPYRHRVVVHLGSAERGRADEDNRLVPRNFEGVTVLYTVTQRQLQENGKHKPQIENRNTKKTKVWTLMGSWAGNNHLKAAVPGKKWLKTREMWLVVLGVILHAVYMLSIFDIYFKTPIVHGMDSVTPRFKAPAKRLVLLVGTFSKLLYFVSVKNDLERPRFDRVAGESHARPPTESRPGHVALIAGFYEDPSADGKLIQLNLIQFLIKASMQFLMLAQMLFRYFVEPCHTSPKILIFMTMKTLQLVHSVKFYKHRKHAYVSLVFLKFFVAGSYGDGHPTNTDTPLVVRGADVYYPKPLSGTYHSDCGFRFVDEHAHDTPTPKEWGLDGIERVDVNQADIAPIMVVLNFCL